MRDDEFEGKKRYGSIDNSSHKWLGSQPGFLGMVGDSKKTPAIQCPRKPGHVTTAYPAEGQWFCEGCGDPIGTPPK